MTRAVQHTSAVLVGLTAILVVLVCNGGGPVVDQVFHALHAGVGHHALHLGLPFAAFVIFATLVWRDVRRHGWPRFSWSL
jgi:hypothetical protein